MRSLVAALALSSLALLAGERTETRTEAFKPGGTLTVRSANGALRITSWDKDQVEIRAEIKEREDHSVKLEVRRTAEGLEVEAVLPSRTWSWGGSDGVSMTLQVPRHLVGRFTTSNGRVEVKGLEGKQEITTSNGSLKLEDLKGDVVARTSNGSVTVRNLDGRLKGGSSNGGVTLERVTGGIDLSTSNAGITAEDLDGRGQGIDLSTSNGSIKVGLGQAKGEIDAKTSNGSVHVDRPGVELVESGKSWARLRVPGSSQSIRLRSSNGSIHLR
mgnify:CR=1 FL=1